MDYGAKRVGAIVAAGPPSDLGEWPVLPCRGCSSDNRVVRTPRRLRCSNVPRCRGANGSLFTQNGLAPSMPSTEAHRPPQAYHRGTLARFVEGFRYGGGIGQWAWLLHRVTGIGILLFLVIHIVDTFLVVALPAEYDFTVDIYGGVFNGVYFAPLRFAFRFAELGLIACVLFHAVNGVRVVLFDFWPGSVDFQRQAFWAVLAVFAVIMVPVTFVVLGALLGPPLHAVR